MPARRTASLLTLAYLSSSLAACMVWQHRSAPPESIVSRSPRLVRVVRSDNSTIEIRRPRLDGDSIVGEAGKPASGRGEAAHVAVAVSDIRQLAVRGVSARRTAALVAGLGATAILVAAAASSETGSGGGGGGGGGGGCIDCVPSCPFVYSWDGRIWRLDSGTFGGAILPVLARTDLDNLEFATATADSLRLRVTNELDETDHIDALRVLAVDHAPDLWVAPGPDGVLHSVGETEPPLAARDFAGRDELPRISRSDGWGWESTPTIRDTASGSRDGVILTFRRKGDSAAGRLVLDAHNTPWAGFLMRAFVEAHGRETEAWYDSVAADPSLARRIGAAVARDAFLAVSVWADGRWEPQGMAWEAGPEIVKRQVVPLDLHRVSGDSVRIRLESAPGLWLIDFAGLDLSAEQPLEVHELALARATDNTGRDVRAVVAGIDGKEYVAERGDTADLVFAVPDRVPGRSRSFLLASTGWYRIHSAAGGAPDRATLSRIGREPGAISRIATERLNEAILAARGSR